MANLFLLVGFWVLTLKWAMGFHLHPPIGYTLNVSLKGSGNQVYQCDGNKYNHIDAGASLFHLQETFEEHRNVLGYHYFLSRSDAEGGRATWSSLKKIGDLASDIPDSTITGKVVFSVRNGEQNIPQLLLRATSHSGKGALSNVAYVQRLQTRGGVPPQSCSELGDIIRVPYKAQYNFWFQSNLIPSNSIPVDLKPPFGHVPLINYYGQGNQIYKFNGNTWELTNVSSTLSTSPGQQPLGLHFIEQLENNRRSQPTWNLFAPLSIVSCEILVKKPMEPGASIDWALFKALRNLGDREMLGSVTYVQRLSTEGGTPPKSQTFNKVGDIYQSPYSAIYWFYVKSDLKVL